jgi:two-component sensor histidine kinase
MSTIPLLNMALLALSLFNAMLLLWLGVTIAFNAARPRSGIYVAGATVVLAGLFFAAHALAVATRYRLAEIDFPPWWIGGWLTVIVLPFAWYGLCLWYAGYIVRNPAYSRARGSHYLFLPVRRIETVLTAVVLTLTLLIMLLFLSLLPLPRDGATRTVSGLLPSLSLGGVPLFAWLYAGDSIFCIALSIYTLRDHARLGPHVDPEAQAFVHARTRARPWLFLTAFALLGVAVIASAVLLSSIYTLREWPLTLLFEMFADDLARVDLVAIAMLSIGIVALGQAVVSYEVLSDRLLPRGELRRQWRNVNILSAGFAVVVSAALTLVYTPVGAAVLAAGLISIFYALLSWRSNQRRDAHVARLLRATDSERVFDAIGDAGRTDDALRNALATLCREVLNVDFADLVPAGDFESLLGKPISFPALRSVAGSIPEALATRSSALPVDPSVFNGAHWAVPLLSRNRLNGVLFLGPARAEAVYTQEQFEIARAHGERLLDAWAMSALTQRLLALQRQRMAESGIADKRMRRVIHDDVLPRVHAALLKTRDQESVQALSVVHRELAGLLQSLPSASDVAGGRGVFAVLRQIVARDLADIFDAVHWEIAADAEHAAARLPDVTAEVLLYAAREAVRNAAQYGRGEGERSLQVWISGDIDSTGLRVSIADDGVGLVATARPADGRGHGLALHSTMLIVVGGDLTLAQRVGGGALVTLHVPLADAPSGSG